MFIYMRFCADANVCTSFQVYTVFYFAAAAAASFTTIQPLGLSLAFIENSFRVCSHAGAS
jgi:hypothetical protein